MAFFKSEITLQSLFYFFYNLPLLIWGTLFLIVMLFLTYFTLNLTDTLLGKFKVDPHVASTFLGINGTIFAILLAMIAVDVLGSFSDAEKNISMEANNIGNIFRFSKHLPTNNSNQIIHILSEYLKFVTNVELPAQDLIHSNIEQVKAQGYNFLDSITHLTLDSQNSPLLQQKLLDSLDALYINRRIRIAATNAHLPNFLWAVLSIGYFLLVVNIGLIESIDKHKHYCLTFISTISVFVIFILLILYNFPFSGEMRANTDPFLQVFRNIQLNSPS
jgi:hypothetical protein